MAAPNFIGVPRDEAVIIDSLRDPSSMVSNRVIFDGAGSLVFFEPSAAPFFTMVGSLKGRRKATQYRFDRFEKPPLPRLVEVNATIASDVVTLVLVAGQGARVRKYDVLLNQNTREVIRVSAVSTDTLTIARALGGSPSAQITAGEKLIIIGNAAEDGAISGDIISSQETNVYNYCQIFRRKIGWSGRQIDTDVYGGDDVTNERRAQGIEHKKDIELGFLFGRRHSLTGPNGRLVTTMGGAEQFVTKNVWDLQGNEPNENQFVEFLEWAMREGDGGNTFGKGVKYLYSCDRLITIIERWARDRIRYVNPLQASEMARTLKVGLRVGEFTTSHGTIMLVRTPSFRMGNEDRALLVDMNHVRYVYHQGRDTKLLKDRQANDADSMEEEWFSDVSCEWTNDAAHAWITNVPY